MKSRLCAANRKAGEVLTAKQALTGPAPPRRSVCAGSDDVFIVSQTSSRKETYHVILFLAAKLEGRRAAARRRTQTTVRQRVSSRPRLEALEDRLVPATAIVPTSLVSDNTSFTPAQVQDPNLVNPWGLAASPTGAWWVANEGTGTSTVYNTSTSPARVESLVVNIPPNPADSPLPAHGSPTGIVYNTSGRGFNVSENGHTGSSEFLFATVDGTISGWSPGVDGTHAIIGATNTGAVYLGLAIASDGHGHALLYASDFARGTIDVYDQNFHLVTTLSGNFTDSQLPSNYHPFNIQAIDNNLYVEYAPADAVLGGTAAPGYGAVDVYNADGQLQQRLIQPNNPHLNEPWAIAKAPANFGSFSNDLLVGNFGDGHINAYNPHSGAFVGELNDANGQPIALTHLWGLAFGNGGAAGPRNTLYFTAGLTSHLAPSNNPFHGLFGSLQVARGHEGDHHHGPPNYTWILSSPTMPSNDLLEQQLAAIFQEFDAILGSLDANLTATNTQLSGFLAQLNANLAALESASPSWM